MEIKRDKYLKQLISFQWDRQVKFITGIRQRGKSYLLMNLYKNYLLENGIPADHVIVIELDQVKDIRYRNVIYNELVVRQFSVDVGVAYKSDVNGNGNSVRAACGIDFVASTSCWTTQ